LLERDVGVLVGWAIDRLPVQQVFHRENLKLGMRIPTTKGRNRPVQPAMVNVIPA
jgi:hypothetical protein